MKKIFLLGIVFYLLSCTENMESKTNNYLSENRKMIWANSIDIKISGPLYLDSIYEDFELTKDTSYYFNLLNSFKLRVKNNDEKYNIYMNTTSDKYVYPDTTLRYDIAGNDTKEKTWYKQMKRPNENRIFYRDTIHPNKFKDYWFSDDFTMKCDTFQFYFTFYPEEEFDFKVRKSKSYTLVNKKLVEIKN